MHWIVVSCFSMGNHIDGSQPHSVIVHMHTHVELVKPCGNHLSSDTALSYQLEQVELTHCLQIMSLGN